MSASIEVAAGSAQTATFGSGSQLVQTLVLRFLKDELGATAIEYGLIAAGISIAIIAVVNGLGTNLNTIFGSVSGQPQLSVLLGRLREAPWPQTDVRARSRAHQLVVALLRVMERLSAIIWSFNLILNVRFKTNSKLAANSWGNAAFPRLVES